MTAALRERESDTLYVTDAELIRRMGVPKINGVANGFNVLSAIRWRGDAR